MKKILYIVPVTILLATACTKTGPSATNPQASTALKAYTSTTLGYGVEYPASWETDPDPGPIPDTVKFSNPDNKESVTITYTENLEQTSLAAPVNQRHSLKQAVSYELSNLKEVTIAGTAGYAGIFNNPTIDYSTTETWFEHNGHVYEILSSNPQTANETKIIQSFKFTDSK